MKINTYLFNVLERANEEEVIGERLIIQCLGAPRGGVSSLSSSHIIAEFSYFKKRVIDEEPETPHDDA